MLNISPEVRRLGEETQAELRERFAQIDRVSEANTEKVLAAFQQERVAQEDFAGTTGYGYNDAGRDKLERIYARIFQTEDALVRTDFANGTHAISCALFGVLRPGDTLLSAIDDPYDTLLSVIGVTGNGVGSLLSLGVNYRKVPLTAENKPDLAGICQAAADSRVRVVLMQRSRGYATRASLSVEEIGALCAAIRRVNPEVYLFVDNCYGEFVELSEPSQVGADLVMGSLIKNPGGGLAPRGGYIAGKKELVDAAGYRLTVPGIGRECGASLGNNRSLYQGIFLSPHVTAQALKTAVFAARLMEKLGYTADPASRDERHDIIQMIHLNTPEAVCRFCEGVQQGAPVDSHVTPIPWDMPGYDCQVIMAAGAFIQGASIELSADAPMRPPYTVYFQGGLTYESGKTGILLAAEALRRAE